MAQTQVSSALSSIRWSQLLEEVYRGRQTYEFKRGGNIPLHSRDIWIVCWGMLQLHTVDCDGNDAILGLAYPEMPFGLPLTQISPYTTTTFSEHFAKKVGCPSIKLAISLSMILLLAMAVS